MTDFINAIKLRMILWNIRGILLRKIGEEITLKFYTSSSGSQAKDLTSYPLLSIYTERRHMYNVLCFSLKVLRD